MSIRYLIAWICLTTIGLNLGGVLAQNYPTKPIRIIATGPGGGNDFQARVIAQGISGTLGPVIVENRSGGLIPGETVAKSPPDGYTLLGSAGVLWIAPFFQKAPYDPIRDFAPITLATTAPTVLVVNSFLPVKSVKDLIALAKANPGVLNYSSAGTGAIAHLTAELFKTKAGVNIVRVAYKTGSAEMADLITGEVHMSFGTVAAMGEQIKAGKLRPLAIGSLKPSSLMPGLPTLAATLPGFESEQLFGILAPAKTPEAIIRRVSQETVRFLNTKEAKDKFSEVRIQTVGNSPDEFSAIIKSEITKWEKLIKDAGIKTN